MPIPWVRWSITSYFQRVFRELCRLAVRRRDVIDPDTSDLSAIDQTNPANLVGAPPSMHAQSGPAEIALVSAPFFDYSQSVHHSYVVFHDQESLMSSL